MKKNLKPYLAMICAMASVFPSNSLWAESNSDDMAFFLFLADSVVNGGELTTPLDLQDVDVAENESGVDQESQSDDGDGNVLKSKSGDQEASNE